MLILLLSVPENGFSVSHMMCERSVIEAHTRLLGFQQASFNLSQSKGKPVWSQTRVAQAEVRLTMRLFVTERQSETESKTCHFSRKSKDSGI